MPVTTIRALPAPTSAPRDPPATLPTCGAVSINAAVTPLVNALPAAASNPVGIGCPGPSERPVGWLRNQRSGRSGTTGLRAYEAVDQGIATHVPHRGVLEVREEHPDEVLVALDDKTDALIRELEQREREAARALRRGPPRPPRDTPEQLAEGICLP